jgi:hypothetical protein
MGLTGNFEQVSLDGEVLTVSGSSSEDSEYELVSREIAVHQEGCTPVHGPASLGQKWTLESLAAPGFTADQALALGCETYFDKNRESAPAFLTFTWSQIVTIAGK